MIGENDEGWQILTLTSERVGDPRACTGEARKGKACRLQQGALAVNAGFPDDVVDEGDVIDDLAERSDDLAEHLAALTVRFESPRPGKAGAGGALEQLDGLARIPRGAVLFFQERFMVKGIDVARRPCHEKLDDPLCPRRRMEHAREDAVPGKHVRESEPGERARECTEELAAVGKSQFTPGLVCVNLWSFHGRKYSRVG